MSWDFSAGVPEHRGELGDDEYHQQPYREYAGDQQHHRIDHGRDDGLAGSGIAFEKLREIGQQLVQDAAFLAGAHDVDVHLVEYPGVLFHGFRQAAALLHLSKQIAHEFAHGRGFGDAFEQAQCPVEGHPGFHQGAQAIGEVEHGIG